MGRAPATRLPDRKLGWCYGSLSLFSAMLHNVFLLYHVEIFVSVYHIDKLSFWVGETVFLAWNSFNDPLFGWISDKRYLSSQAVNDGDVVLRRLKSLMLYGPFFGISFLAFWISWAYPSIQFVICLCVYDGFLTMIDLHHSSLLADLAVSAQARTSLNFYCSLFSAFGAVSVFLSYVVWNRNDLMSFQAFCVILTVISVTGFYVSTRILRSIYLKEKISRSSMNKPNPARKDSDEFKPERALMKKFILQLARHQNFVWFAVMNLVQVFHCHFNSNFFPLFLENLLGDSITATTASILLGVSFVAPHINNLYFLKLCQDYGVYMVIKMLFVIKLALGIFMYYMGPQYPWLLALFIASNRVFTEGTCKLLNLVISDLVDEDYVLHGRTHAVSALMFGTAALVSKPGQTLAPLMGTWILSVHTGHDVFQSGTSDGSIKLDTREWNEDSRQMYRYGVFQILVFIPMVCAIVQLIAWSRYTLHGKRLSWVKSMRAGAQYAV